VPKGFDGFRNGGVDAVLICNVELHRNTVGTQFARCLLGSAEIDISQSNLRTFAQIGLGKGAPDPSGGASYQCRFACQAHQAILKPSASNLWIMSARGDNRIRSP
jgi:hypothetical protein